MWRDACDKQRPLHSKCEGTQQASSTCCPFSRQRLPLDSQTSSCSKQTVMHMRRTKDTHSTRSKWVSVKVQMSCSIYKGYAHSLWDKTTNFSHVRNTMPMWGLITLRATNLLKENRGKRGKGNTFPTGLIYSLGSLHACFVAIAAWGWYHMLPTVLPTRKKILRTSLRVMWKIRHTIPNCAQVCTELLIGYLNCREVAI